LKLNLNEVTLIIVDCVNTQRAEKSLEHNKSMAKFRTAKLLTSLESKHPQKETIPHIGSIEQYSNFMVKELANYFKSKYVLVAQYDGFIINPSKWQHQFLKYDYIGAPWPEQFLNHGFPLEYNVGNGGFSLRSKKLQLALQDPEIQVTRPEDVTICQEYRPYLEAKYGIQFAPQEVAQYFSYENPPWDIAKAFGQHGNYKIT
jgi:hypothetical protein